MSGELVAALDFSFSLFNTCKGRLSFDKQSYTWSCGLSISVPSTATIAADSYLLRSAKLFQAAHQKHHDHKGRQASIYFESKGEPLAVTSVLCSCDYDPMGVALA